MVTREWAKGAKNATETEKEIPNWVDYFWCCICMLCSFTFFGCFGRFAKTRKEIVHVHIISLHCLELILTARITIDRSFFPSRSLSPQLNNNCLHSHCAHGQNLFKIWSQHSHKIQKLQCINFNNAKPITMAANYPITCIWCKWCKDKLRNKKLISCCLLALRSDCNGRWKKMMMAKVLAISIGNIIGF